MQQQTSGATRDRVRMARPWAAVLVVVVALVFIGAALWAWRASRASYGEEWAPGAIDVVTVTLKPEAAPVSLRSLGELRAERQVTLAAEAAGRVSSISFESGQHVKAGAVLVRLDDSSEQADLTAARSAAALASDQLTRANTLAETGALSKEMRQQRQSERERAVAQVMQLEAQIRKMQIRAPFAGILGLRQVDLGQYVNPGDNAVTLTDLDALHVNFEVPQQDLSQLRVGQRVEIQGDNPQSVPVNAVVQAIEPQVGRSTRNASVRAQLGKAEHGLMPGMFVSVAVQLPAEADALLVPASAIVTSSSGDTVLVVRGASADTNGKAEMVAVVSGRRLGDRVVVESGLKAGDIVITEGQLRVQPGSEVRRVDALTPAAAEEGGW